MHGTLGDGSESMVFTQHLAPALTTPVCLIVAFQGAWLRAWEQTSQCAYWILQTTRVKKQSSEAVQYCIIYFSNIGTTHLEFRSCDRKPHLRGDDADRLKAKGL